MATMNCEPALLDCTTCSPKPHLLGSLIDTSGGDLMSPQRLGQIEPLLDRLVEKARQNEPERAKGAIAAKGMADAAAILGQEYALVATNVPFLGRGKQCSQIAAYIELADPDAKADLATAMLSRALRMLTPGGTVASVTPQTWFSLGGYKALRRRLLTQFELNAIIDLGPAAFHDMNWWAARTALIIVSSITPDKALGRYVFTAGDHKETDHKSTLISSEEISFVSQNDQISNPDARFSLENLVGGIRLSEIADFGKGSTTGDGQNYLRQFWENDRGIQTKWLNSPSEGKLWSGRSAVLRVPIENSTLNGELGCRLHGQRLYGKRGIAINKMKGLATFIYDGEVFDDNIGIILPYEEGNIPAILEFCSSPIYRKEVRSLDQALKVTAATLVKVPFDISEWSSAAAKRYPDGLPEPYSDDPTQWLFHGHPAQSERGTQLHVALARLAGYRWPAESDPEMRLAAEAREWVAKAATLPEPDADGVLPILAVAGDRPLADRLRDYLNLAIPGWDEATLVRDTDERIDKGAGKDLSLEAWLRDRAFRQHSALFHNRPFLWQVWDGQKDGFSAFLHYHRLDHAALQKLTYTLLGAWIARRKAENDERRVEAGTILQRKLEAILEGEAPYDIFVRWKSLDQQPVGWNPDLDDGVRLNIRPWIEAGVLKDAHPKGIKWGVDRGKDVASAPWFSLDKGERNNDRHTTLAEKHAAREAAAATVGKA
jgi:hypothetical protein